MLAKDLHAIAKNAETERNQKFTNWFNREIAPLLIKEAEKGEYQATVKIPTTIKPYIIQNFLNQEHFRYRVESTESENFIYYINWFSA
jgi:hypothetical protein